MPQTPPEPSAAPAPSLSLSARDVERLLNEETPDIRSEIARKVAADHAIQRYSEREYLIAEQIFHLLVRDTEISVRATLAETLKDNPNVPHDVIFALAQDVDAIALPVIESSEVLTEDDLITIIRSATAQQTERGLAIAGRAHVSESVSSALIDTHHPPTVKCLIGNPGAIIGDAGYQKIIHHHGKDTEMMDALADRPKLPATIVEKVITLVSSTMAERVRQTYGLTSPSIAADAEKSREIATLKLVDGQAATQEIDKLIEQLYAFGRLNPSIILTSLCRGNLYFFEASLARLSSVPVKNARILIHDKGGMGFRALYAKAGLPESFMTAARLLLQVVATLKRAGKPFDSNTLAQTLIAASATEPVENLSYILALIRQNAG